MVVGAVPSPSDGLSAMYQASASASGKSGRFTRASTYGAGKVRCMSIPFLGGVAGRARVYVGQKGLSGPEHDPLDPAIRTHRLAEHHAPREPRMIHLIGPSLLA